jgi:arylsulfatase A-like enzyme
MGYRSTPFHRSASRASVAVIVGLAILQGASIAPAAPATPDRPNIVYILADDLGYGDVRCFNPSGEIPTPHIDRLAAQGMRFTDAHSGSAVCTPTRYGILTGRYAWRSRLQGSVLGGYSPPLIEPDRLTVAEFLRRHGYHTACIGKWHLGLGWATSRPAAFVDYPDPDEDISAVRYDRPFSGGPTALGFDRFFGISGALDMPPYIFLRDDRCVGVPTTEKTYIRTGPAARDFNAVNVMPALARETVRFLDAQRADPRRRPFFLYLALTAPHTPILPTRHFRGRTGMGPYADFVSQVDATVGGVLQALDRDGLGEATLVIFTSDNGCSPSADFAALAEHGHHPSGPFRGCKADIFEGGHRVPFIARWPGRVKAGSTCKDTICLNDLMATTAAIVGDTLPADAGGDSVSILPDLLGTAVRPVREATVHHSIFGSFAIRQGPWKLILCPDSGGWSSPRPGSVEAEGLPPIQLYDLSRDPGERRNVQADHREIVARLARLLERYVSDGRSTPGKRLRNEVAVELYRRPAPR